MVGARGRAQKKKKKKWWNQGKIVEKGWKGRLWASGSCGHEVSGKKMDLSWFLFKISIVFSSQYLSCQWHSTVHPFPFYLHSLFIFFSGLMFHGVDKSLSLISFVYISPFLSFPFLSFPWSPLTILYSFLSLVHRQCCIGVYYLSLLLFVAVIIATTLMMFLTNRSLVHPTMNPISIAP